MTIIDAINVEKRITTLDRPIDILKGVNLKVNEGESVAIAGASGSGKTTLLSLLAGLDIPTSGEIVVDGVSLSKQTEDQRARLRLGKVGFVFQNFELLPSLTAQENVMLPLELCQKPHPKEQAQEILTKVGLHHRLTHYPYQLSGGEQQRVAIARAYAIKPKILFADEPTGCLDTNTGDAIIALLFTLQHQLKTTLIFVTHDLNLAQKCGSVYVLEQGKLHLKQDT
ncbi:MAG: ABC transporter ATP-binding protein [Proteobacteria bacterium]|nr:ABC transporter ATP-binding protein [Pseudomonadota bacterium]